MFVEQMASFLSPWNALYSDSTVVSTAVTSMHIVALLFGGGLALAADRSTLRALRRPEAERRTQLRELSDVHRPVLIALSLLFMSGLAMAAADVESFATSPFFWVKMSLVALLLANGWWLQRTERRLKALALKPDAPLAGVATAPLWRRLRRASVTSLMLWTLTALAGAVLTGAA